MSFLEKCRLRHMPAIPSILHHLSHLKKEEARAARCKELKELFPETFDQPKLRFCKGEARTTKPLRVGVVLSGGQAAGGHNVIAGLYDGLKQLHPDSKLLGFLDGPSGIIENSSIELTDKEIDACRNCGGFDLIGAGRTKIETPEQFAASKMSAENLKLDGIVIIGGDDSNTNAALLAEYFLQQGVATQVVGVPKTIDGDLKNEEIEVSFGFDTAVKTFSETIGNIARDSLSAKKYYFFIKLMGRSASHIALECALQTHPNLTLIGEEAAASQRTFQEITDEIADMICSRADRGKNYGVILIPEGIIEFIPEFRALIQELNRLDLSGITSDHEKREYAEKHLSEPSRRCFSSMPNAISHQLLLDRDPHGNVQVSKIETERLFVEAVKAELQLRKERGEYSGKFSAQPLFCGYEGRSCFPSNFDSNYCYSLGLTAALLIEQEATGYMACLRHLAKDIEQWVPMGIPIASMIVMEERKGKKKPVIEKALVDLKGNPFQQFQKQREAWKEEDHYLYPGPIQFFGPKELTDSITVTLRLENP